VGMPYHMPSSEGVLPILSSVNFLLENFFSPSGGMVELADVVCQEKK